MNRMPTVGEQLRSGREAMNLTLHQVAETTKMRTDHIRAVEEGRYEVFVAPVYIRGFVRTYCKLLKLDVNAIMAALDQELGGTKKFNETLPRNNEPRGVLDFVMLQLSKVKWRKGGALIAVFGIVALVLLVSWVWRYFQKDDPVGGAPPPGKTLSVPPPKR